jgi:predicted transglutaminase-like cysteine proteinase
MRGVLPVLALLVALAAPAQAAPVYPQIFGSNETASQNLKLFTKWLGVLDRQTVEQKLEDTPCTQGPFNKCFLQRWKHYLGGIQNLPPLDKLREVNRFANHAPYITDPVNYGMADYWATPGQFLSKDGDCEDYAIVKFYSLLTLGIPNDQMRVVVLNDLNLHVAHAVLVVYLDGVAWLLDNQIRDVVRADVVRHYRAIYSVNETTWWLHRY